MRTCAVAAVAGAEGHEPQDLPRQHSPAVPTMWECDPDHRREAATAMVTPSPRPQHLRHRWRAKAAVPVAMQDQSYPQVSDIEQTDTSYFGIFVRLTSVPWPFGKAHLQAP